MQQRHNIATMWDWVKKLLGSASDSPATTGTVLFTVVAASFGVGYYFSRVRQPPETREEQPQSPPQPPVRQAQVRAPSKKPEYILKIVITMIMFTFMLLFLLLALYRCTPVVVLSPPLLAALHFAVQLQVDESGGEPEESTPMIEECSQDDFKEEHGEFLDHPNGLTPDWEVFDHKLEYTIPFPWEKVTSKMWSRFPDEKYPDVKVDTVSCRRSGVREDIEFIHRRVQTVNRAPAAISAVLGSKDELEFDEKSIQEHNNRVLTQYLVNKDFTHLLQSQAVTVYREHPSNPNWTLMEQSMGLKVLGMATWFKGQIRGTTEDIFESESEDQAIRLIELLRSEYGEEDQDEEKSQDEEQTGEEL